MFLMVLVRWLQWLVFDVPWRWSLGWLGWFLLFVERKNEARETFWQWALVWQWVIESISHQLEHLDQPLLQWNHTHSNGWVDNDADLAHF